MSQPVEAASQANWTALNDRRRSPRLECLGSAQVRMLNVESTRDAQFDGKIVNLSLVGCCFESNSPVVSFRLQDFVEVHFQINGITMLLMGSISAIHSSTKFGIDFQNVGSRKQDQLRYIISDLTELLNEKNNDKNREEE